MRPSIRIVFVVVLCVAALSAGLWTHQNYAVAGVVVPDAGHDVYLPAVSSGAARSIARTFNSDQAGILATGGGHVLSVGPRSVPTYDNGSAATLNLSIDTTSAPPSAPPTWARVVSPPVKFDPAGFNFNFALTVRLPVAGVNDVANLYFMRYNPTLEMWTRSIFATDFDNPTAVETTLFNLGHMVVGEYDGVIPEAAGGMTPMQLRPQGGLYVPFTLCPIGGRDCFYYLTIQNFVPKYPNEVPAGAFNGTTLRLRSNVTGESPEPTGWLLPQGTYTFCYSALESPLTLSNLRKFTNTNPQVVTIDQPYHCGLTLTCKTTVNIGGGLPGWGEASDDRPCAMGAGVAPGNPANLGNAGDFQATLRWTNSSDSATDIDLHLYGPNGLHVYYDAKVSGDGSLRLDRDWRSEVGSAVENIYQVKDSAGKSIPMPAGSYALDVVHYSGATNKTYEVRVIHKGAVTNYSGQVSVGQTRRIVTFNVP